MTTDRRNDDIENARRLVDANRDQIRWVPEWGDWLVWDKTRWAMDAGGGAVVRFAIEAARGLWELVPAAGGEKERMAAARWAMQSGNRQRIEAMIGLSRADERVVVRPDQLDADPWLLNCANGTVDLRSGRLLSHSKSHLITKTTGINYLPDAGGELFADFLATVQPDDDMRGYLCRLIGHTLVGEVLEHQLPIWHGTGGNGKGTLTELLLATLGDYASTVPASLLLVKTQDEHPNALADLHGVRLVFGTETAETKRMDEATVKMLTGGDSIKARFLYKEFFRFVPSHSVVLVTNYAPAVRGTDHGIWRRLRLIPWPVQIETDKVNLQLGTQLRAEREAVLAWAVRGCLDWQAGGMGEPVMVTNATGEYRTGEDIFGRFLEDKCDLGALLTVSARTLRGAYQLWCQDEGEEPLSANDVATQLRSRGCKDYRSKRERGWKGVGLATERRW